ncbi:MAG: L-ribulose-5-phosphate 4-epimerase [Bacteroidetes bacterium]|nr:MAG: L-ribulose-5-phosphate 4-epimerase [Bacteroidota bacterium]
MLEHLKERVLASNLALVTHNLVIFTWGNVSERDPESGLIVIKPSGMAYDEMGADDMVVLDPEGRLVEGKLRPSTDAPTHLHLYASYGQLNGIVHTHSEWATSWAQAGRSIPPYGTTHADYFYGAVPCSRPLNEQEMEGAYEENTGRVIVETMGETDPLDIPGVLVHSHGPFTWGRSAEEAVHNAVVLEELAKMAFRTEVLGQRQAIPSRLLDKHFLRKHGAGAYYGQMKKD